VQDGFKQRKDRAESIADRQDGQKFLRFIAVAKMVTLEMIVERFP
jgi:hypothetical protein